MACKSGKGGVSYPLPVCPTDGIRRTLSDGMPIAEYQRGSLAAIFRRKQWDSSKVASRANRANSRDSKARSSRNNSNPAKVDSKAARTSNASKAAARWEIRTSAPASPNRTQARSKGNRASKVSKANRTRIVSSNAVAASSHRFPGLAVTSPRLSHPALGQDGDH